METNIRKISLNDWKLFSNREHSKNFISLDGNYILKTTPSGNENYNEFKSIIKLSQNINALGIPTPMALEVVKTETGYGLISEYIENKKSLSRIIGEDFDNMDKYMKIFSDMAKTLHNTKCDTTNFKSVEERIDYSLSKFKLFNEKEIKAIKKLSNNLSNTDTCLHLDLQMSNIIISPKGNYFIDTDLFSYGNPLYDISMLYSFLAKGTIAPEKAALDLFHFGKDKSSICWLSFLKHYYNMTDKNEIEKFEKKLAPIGIIVFIIHAPYVPIVREHLSIWRPQFFNETFKEFI